MPPKRITLKTAIKSFQDKYGYKPHGNNKQFKELMKEYNVKSFKSPKERREFLIKVNNEPIRYIGSTSIKFLIEFYVDVDEGYDGIYELELKDKKETKYKFEDIEKFNTQSEWIVKNLRKIEWYNIPFDKKIKDKNEIDVIVNKEIEDYLNAILKRPYVRTAQVLEINKSIFKYQDTDLRDVRMKKSGSLMIDGYDDKQEWDTRTDKCVFDYLINTYKNIKGFKKVCNYETIKEIFDDDDTLNNGVNSWNIRKWCMEYNISMSAFDDREKRFFNYTPEKRNKNAPSILYRISDGHFYPIPENLRKTLITIATQVDSKSDVLYHHIKDDKKEKNPIKDIIVLENTDPLYELGKVLNEKHKKPRSLIVNDGNLKSFEIDKISYTINQFIPITKELCENMNIEYTGQTIGGILQDIIKSSIDGELKTSHHNPNVFNSLNLAKKNRVHKGLIDEKYINLLDDDNTIARDFNKQYSSILYNPLEEWVRYDFNDEWVEYDYEYGNNVKLGLYKVITDNTTLFRRTDIYSSSIINKAIQENIDFVITHKLKPSYKENKNIFKLIIDNILKHCKGKKEIYKLLINMMSGMMAKTKCKYGKYNINNNINQIFSFIKEYPDMKPVIIKIPNTEHFVYGCEKEMTLTENNLGMYIQLLDQSNIKLYDMVKEMEELGGLLIARNVDCGIFHFKNKVPKLNDSNKWGYCRNCSIPKIKHIEDFKHKDYRLNKLKWTDLCINDSDKWEQIKDAFIRKGGLLLQADAGCGKTYVAKKIANCLDNVKIIAPTNKAALNIGGTTIHKFLNMNLEGKISTAKLNSIKKNIEYIIVDEISMITKELWRRLAFVKKATDVKFLLLGDNKQLPPVENEKIDDYFNHSAVKYLCNNNRNILNITKRYNLELKKYLNDVENLDISKFPYKETEINICYTNKTRIKINKKWNEKLKPNNSLFIPLRENDIQGQDIYIYKGLPLIARENDNKKNMYLNNETFEVLDYDNDNVLLQSERVDENGKIEKHVIDINVNNIQEYFYLNYCTTIHKVQGTTIRDNFTIWDWSHNRMNCKSKYTALSRGVNPENISIVA